MILKFIEGQVPQHNAFRFSSHESGSAECGAAADDPAVIFVYLDVWILCLISIVTLKKISVGVVLYQLQTNMKFPFAPRVCNF